jgi:uncharacterized protein
MTVTAGSYHTLKVVKGVDFGVYLDGGDEEILLPKRFIPDAGLQAGDEINVFVYHDSDNRLIATTQHPKGQVGDIVMLEVVSTTKQGAFLDWGLMKDLFIPISQQEARLNTGDQCLVKIYRDEQTGRVAATAKISNFLSNYELTVAEKDEVNMVVFQKTDIGYKVIVNNKHLGVLHYNEVFRELEIGEQIKGFVKHIRPDNKIDVVMGSKGFKRAEDEEGKIIRLLEENSGYLPYHDKSDPEEIYDFFGMSKKTFKMAIGSLYKQRKLSFTQTGIRLTE